MRKFGSQFLVDGVLCCSLDEACCPEISQGDSFTDEEGVTGEVCVEGI